MFAHLVTAAKGLFTGQEPQDAPTDPAGASTATTSNMVSATRRGVVAPEPEKNGVAKHGKRKAQPAAAEKTDDKQSKRRKRNSLEAADASSDDAADAPEESDANGTKKQKPSASASKAHFRFDSEEPAVPEHAQPEEISQTSNHDKDEEDSDDDDDDDAPEAIDNSAQLLKMKEQAKKQEKAKQLYVISFLNACFYVHFTHNSCREEQSKKEKRRKLDERRKLQAKSSKVNDISAASDDLLSESTATLQGSTTQDARRRALPALLPDDILNADLVVRPPTPPAEEFAVPKKSNKLRFLDKTEKAPKDVQVGDVTIRVLDAPSTKATTKPALAPKASKTGRNVKENWLKRERSTAKVNGMRRTAGGPSGFKRR